MHVASEAEVALRLESGGGTSRESLWNTHSRSWLWKEGEKAEREDIGILYCGIL